ncbi:hypothetical protein V9K67_14975 [Paraflavisolibacter sp. H34]|uniref:hypothetical protein n=1 Tax=Huijunlia imazamoxiresistens TaxID=3127457 RepID=UPI003018CE7E
MRYLPAIVLLLSLTCCKKIKENIQEEAVLDVVTSGQWKISRFQKGDSTLTREFSAYRFRFQGNLKVEALKDGTPEAEGTWTGDQATQTITSRFTTTQRPLVLLNGAWKINRGSESFVEASQAHSESTCHIRLEKL